MSTLRNQDLSVFAERRKSRNLRPIQLPIHAVNHVGRKGKETAPIPVPYFVTQVRVPLVLPWGQWQIVIVETQRRD
jgi:hypothetical protein